MLRQCRRAAAVLSDFSSHCVRNTGKNKLGNGVVKKMTKSEVIARYGDKDGYINCMTCPLKELCDMSYSGFEDCWDAIQTAFEDCHQEIRKEDADKRRILMLRGEKIPCSLCRYAPPSDDDGKPCTCCPAEGV